MVAFCKEEPQLSKIKNNHANFSNELNIIKISKQACWLFLSQIIQRKITQRIIKPGSNFNVMTIDKTNPLRKVIDTLLQNYDIAVARIYQFFPGQKDSAHIDHLFPDKKVIVIRLNHGDPRLIINSKPVREKPGQGYIFSSDTMYEVSKGRSVRYSLVLWGNEKSI